MPDRLCRRTRQDRVLTRRVAVALLGAFLAWPVGAADKAFDAAAAFGARQDVNNLVLSPDGTSVAFLAPRQGQGSALVVMNLANQATTAILNVSGAPDRLEGCRWVSNQRLVCSVYGVVRSGDGLLPMTRVVAVDRNGANLKVLSNQSNPYTRGYLLDGGEVIDWLPEEDGNVLMTREYMPDDHLGSRMGSSKQGLGVDHIDTRSLASTTVEQPVTDAVDYISDRHGTVRVMGRAPVDANHRSTGKLVWSYRKRGSREWLKLADYDQVSREGFLPEAVDPGLDVVYGFRKEAGRMALHSLSLDGALTERVIFTRPDVDVDRLARIGRNFRVVGVSYATDVYHVEYFDPQLQQLRAALSRALPQQQISIVDSSADEQKLLVFAGSDADPGVYYLFDRSAKKLQTFLVARAALEGVRLATVKSISYPAADAVAVPAYLTYPPGQEQARGLPAIVLPHGGPSARDVWGFDWLAQFYAARGFVVLQPNFRGSAGYGDAWLRENGFRSWRLAIGDVLDAGRWLVAQGIADPGRLYVAGWSYGGYAALQAAVTDAAVFKAVVAIAPVTDLKAAEQEWRDWSNYNLVKAEIGTGPDLREGSPALNASRIKVPVLLFHGELDRNVAVGQSREMANALAAAGVRHEFVTWPGLDHSLDDSAARTQLLRQSEAFLRSVDR